MQVDQHQQAVGLQQLNGFDERVHVGGVDDAWGWHDRTGVEAQPNRVKPVGGQPLGVVFFEAIPRRGKQVLVDEVGAVQHEHAPIGGGQPTPLVANRPQRCGLHLGCGGLGCGGRNG